MLITRAWRSSSYIHVQVTLTNVDMGPTGTLLAHMAILYFQTYSAYSVPNVLFQVYTLYSILTATLQGRDH